MAGDEANEHEPAAEAHAEPNPMSFGPLGSFEALTNLQRQGIAAASEVAERFTQMLGGFDQWAPRPPSDDMADPASGGESSVGGPSDTESLGDLRASVARGFDLYSRMFQQTFESWADMVEDRMRDRGIRLGSEATDDAVAVGVAGSIASGELWLHNHTTEAVGPLHLIATPGFAADGRTVSPAAIRLDPPVADVGPESSLRIEVTVDLAGVDPGPLHAMVLVRDLPDEALPLRILAHDQADALADEEE